MEYSVCTWRWTNESVLLLGVLEVPEAVWGDIRSDLRSGS
jgi:hypothetical protein